jgi:hypothetical protein
MLTSLGLAITLTPWYIPLSPASVWIVSYFILQTGNKFDRVTQSLLIAEIYFLLSIILSKFQTNPAGEIVAFYMPIIIGISLLASILLTVFIRREQKAL